MRKKLALAAGVVVATLVAAEGLARVVVARVPRFAAVAARDWYVRTPDTGWERRPEWSGKVYGAWREFGERGLLAEDALEGDGRPRVVLLGDSCTFGHRVAVEKTFARELERRLGDVDVVNLGVPGYSSFQALALLEKVALELEPDAIVFSTSFNDRRYVTREEDARFDWVGGAEAWGSAGERLARASRLVGVLRALGGGESEEESRPAEGLALGDLRPRVGPERYGEHLERVAALAAEAGVAVVFLVLGDAPEETAALREAQALRAAGELVAAAERLGVVVEAGGMFEVVARVERAEVLEELGRPEEARRTRELERFVPSLHGGLPLERDGVYQAVMREVGGRTGAVVVEGAAALAPADWFDFCHFGPSGHAKIAAALEGAVRAALAR